MDASQDVTGDVVDEEDILEIRDCDLGSHLDQIEDEIKNRVVNSGITKCIDMSKAKVSGGTLDTNTEHIVIVQWQHCEKFKPSSECATE